MSQLKAAIDLLESQQYEEAKELLEELAMDNPKDADVLYNLGMCYTELGNPEAAVRTLDQCIQHNDQFTNAYVARGYAKMLLEQPAEAIDDLETALDHDPNNIHALRNLGGAYGKMDQYEKTLVYLKRAYDHAPDNPQVAFGLGFAYKQLGDYQRADEIFKTMLDGYLPDKYRELAEAEMREIAEETFREVGFRSDAMYYCLSAFEKFQHLSRSEVQQITFEIAMKGRGGFEVNNPKKKYRIQGLDGEFTGLQLVSYMYVGFRQIDQSVDIGFDLSEEYRLAKQMFEEGMQA